MELPLTVIGFRFEILTSKETTLKDKSMSVSANLCDIGLDLNADLPQRFLLASLLNIV
jgi:hypothetical protein